MLNNKRALLLRGPFVIPKQFYVFVALLDLDKTIGFDAAFGASLGRGSALLGQATDSTLPFETFGHCFLLAVVGVYSEASCIMGFIF